MTNLISRTGRVQSWMDDPSGRLPVSCTVFVVENEMEGPNGIEASWRFASHALRFGAGCAIHLSKLDHKGYTRESGVVASGPVSFGKIYSTLNEILRRGGIYKNGAIVLHLDLSHPDAWEFINTPRSELPWVKRCINITEEWWEEFKFKDDLLHGIKSGDIWLNKVKHDDEGNRIRGNVCLEVYLPSRGTCHNMSILVPVSSTTSPVLLFSACPSCAHSIAKQVLESLESTFPLTPIDKLDLECWDWPISCIDTD